VDTVIQWLVSQGFRLNSVAPGRRIIDFSGTAHQVERAFHTEIHHFDLDGERHVANAGDIAIPEALASVVSGLASLHTSRHKPLHHLVAAPMTTLTTGGQGVSPYDFATIYNVLPLWNNGFDGAGQSIAIAGRTNIKLSDV